MDFQKIISEQMNTYPMMEPVDFGKLAYQSEFGPKHLGVPYEKAKKVIEKEWNDIDLQYTVRTAEYIGNRYYRVHFWKNASQAEKELLTKLFLLTAEESQGTFSGLRRRLKQVRSFNIPGFCDWLKNYDEKGYPVISHSDRYKLEYHPHYRLIHRKFECWYPVLSTIGDLLNNKNQVVIAIDGNCGSGKTTLAALIEKVYGGNVFHMDDYYLPITKRKDDWEHIPAGNMDLVRFSQDVLKPATEGKSVIYQPFDCQKKDYKVKTIIAPDKLTIVEGSYSQHPILASMYDLKIFLCCDENTQTIRLTNREGNYYSEFEKRWIPMEKRYHETFKIKENSDLIYHTGGES